MRHIALVVMLMFFCPVLGVSAQDANATIITVDSTNLRFSPSDVTIEEGQTVRFFWSGQALPHNAVEENGVFDSGEPERDVDYSFTFERGMNGTYQFVCEPHAALGMVGSITVTPLPPLDEDDNQTNSSASPSDNDQNTPFASPLLTLTMIGLAAVMGRKLSSKPIAPESRIGNEYIIAD